jgi:hypothetical protein
MFVGIELYGKSLRVTLADLSWASFGKHEGGIIRLHSGSAFVRLPARPAVAEGYGVASK